MWHLDAEFSTIAVKCSVCRERCQDLCSFGALFIAEIINCAHRLDFSTGDGFHSVLEWAVVTSISLRPRFLDIYVPSITT